MRLNFAKVVQYIAASIFASLLPIIIIIRLFEQLSEQSKLGISLLILSL